MPTEIGITTSILEVEFYKNSNALRLFVHLLLTSNTEEGIFEGVPVPRGSLATGRKSLAEQLGMSEQEIRTALSTIKSTSKITSKVFNKFSIISITNYEDFVISRKTSTSKSTSKSTTILDSSINSNLNTKSSRYTGLQKPDDVSEQIWADHLAIRKAKGVRMTQTALDGMRREAQKAGMTLEQALTESCERGWASFKAEWVKKDLFSAAAPKGQKPRPQDLDPNFGREGKVMSADDLERICGVRYE